MLNLVARSWMRGVCSVDDSRHEIGSRSRRRGDSGHAGGPVRDAAMRAAVVSATPQHC